MTHGEGKTFEQLLSMRLDFSRPPSSLLSSAFRNLHGHTSHTHSVTRAVADGVGSTREYLYAVIRPRQGTGMRLSQSELYKHTL